MNRYSDANINEKLLLKVAFKNFFSGIFFGESKNIFGELGMWPSHT